MNEISSPAKALAKEYFDRKLTDGQAINEAYYARRTRPGNIYGWHWSGAPDKAREFAADVLYELIRLRKEAANAEPSAAPTDGGEATAVDHD